jgi:hypothetical protein
LLRPSGDLWGSLNSGPEFEQMYYAGDN